MSQMIESFMNEPASVAGPVQPLSFEELPTAGASGAPLVRDPHPLHAVKVSLQVCVGEATMTLGDLLAARHADVLALDRAVDQPVDLLLDGRVVARGQLVAIDGAFGVRITEPPLPLAP